MFSGVIHVTCITYCRWCHWHLMVSRAVHKTRYEMNIVQPHTAWWSGWMFGLCRISSLVSWLAV